MTNPDPQITKLERELANGSRPAETILAEIRAISDAKLLAAVEESRQQATKLQEAIVRARAPIAGHEAELEILYEKEPQVIEALKAAQAAFDTIKERIGQLEHLIKDCDRKGQIAEIEYWKHVDSASKALAA